MIDVVRAAPSPETPFKTLMKPTILSLLTALIATCSALGQVPNTPPKTQGPKLPKTITAEQVKAVWIKKLVPPRALDQNYHQTIKSFRNYIAEIKSGKLDLQAQETAATYNRNRSLQVGDSAAAAIYESELKRIADLKSAAAQRAQAEEDSATFRNQMSVIDSKLRSLETAVEMLGRP